MSAPPQPLALVTSGSRGLGRTVALKLAHRGMRVLVTAREQVSAEDAAAEIRCMVPSARAEGMALDLASLASVRAFAAAFLGLEPALDLLVNNAGSLETSATPEYTAEGHEKIFATHHLGHFLLTRLLLDALQRAPAGRIVVVTSRLHQPGSRGPPARFDFDDLRGERQYDPVVAYKNSKLANLWFTYALHRRLQGTRVTVNAVCPGFVPETLAERRAGLARMLYKHVLPRFPFARTLDEATDNMLFVATDPSLAGVSGQFFCEQQATPSSPESYDEEKQERLWAVSEALCEGVAGEPEGRLYR